jgi:hypothetical protein
MDANTYPLRNILSQERRYLIPTFQRDYEWNESEQWALLFEDLESVADRLMDARAAAEQAGHSVETAEKKVAPHFLGAIVLDQLPSSAGGIDLRSVIDGQQRLTTLQLLLRGLLDVLVEKDSSRVKQVRRLLQNPDDVTQNDDERYKLWPRRHDRDVWRAVMADDPSLDGHAPHLYAKARAYFAGRTRTALTELGSDERLDVLVDAALSLFKIVVIDLEDNDDAQIIFEVLNGRQTPLSPADLVKNLLFLRAELDDEDELQALYDLYWSSFDDGWWKTNVGRGHAARGRRDVLLSSWLAAASASEPSIGHLYAETRKYMDASGRTVPDLLQELAAYRSAYESVYERVPTRSARVAAAYRRIDGLGVTTALPLLLWLETLHADVLSPAEHERAVLAVESWVVRRIITAAQTRGYGKVFIDVLGAAKQAPPNHAATAVIEALAALKDQMAWPDDETVEDALVARRLYNELSQGRVRMLLGAIDDQLQRERPWGEHPAFDYDKLQIEHVMPQSWTTHWPVDADEPAEKELAEQRRRAALGKIGNLTLITAPLNQSVSNGSWDIKREGLRQHSKLELNAALVQRDVWDEAAIDERSRELARVACRVWGDPSALEADVLEA